METKICSRCKEEKELSDFCKVKKTKDGLNYHCRKCTSNYTKVRTVLGKSRVYQKIKNRQNKLNGKCYKCIQKRLTTSKYCLYHFIYGIVKNWKLPKAEIEKTIQGLIKKLENSEYCCHYSGLKITPGFSASIDHRIPQSKGGTHDLSNLVWCHMQINRLKLDLSEKEFINRSANILVDLNYLDSKGQL